MASQNNSKPPSEVAESRLLISYAFDLARQLGIDHLLVLADLLQDRRAVESHRKKEAILWVVRGEGTATSIAKLSGDHCIEIPQTEVGRMDQVKLALILAVLREAINVEASVVCLTGAAGSKRLDSLIIANPKRDFPWFADRKITVTDSALTSREFARLLEIGLRFATEGREGKPIGTSFVLGDAEALSKYTRPLIMNPCEGHPRKARQIHNVDYLETLRELAGLDGAFIVDKRGTVDRAGVYLDAPVTKKVKVAKGLGARHTSAAAITAKTDAIALVISESSRTLTVFSGGAPVLQIGRQ